jgi:hypothetical protein
MGCSAFYKNKLRASKIHMVSAFVLLLAAQVALAQASKDSSAVSFSWNGEWRNFLMYTGNAGSLKDWNALATGGRVGGKMALPKGFSLGIQAYATVRVLGNDNSASDSATGAGSRYEPTLFDRANPSRDITAFIGQLYLDYSHGKNAVRVGRQLFESPLLNGQDGRMIPTLVEGLWLSRKERRMDFGLGYIWAIAPRGIGGFSRVENTFGALTQGKSVLGVAANYQGNIQSRGMVVAKVEMKPMAGLGFRAWNYYVDNVFNSLYLEADQSYSFSQQVRLKISGQYIWQSQINGGGNKDLSKAYFDEDQSHTFGLKGDLKLREQWTFTLAGNATTARGRFLFPREWGREELYTFLRRERSEGSGASKAVMMMAQRKSGPWDLRAAWGRYWRSAPEDALYNKYGMPSYDHVELAAKRQFSGPFSRLNAELIFVYKYDPFGNKYAPQYTINRVNMVHVDFILNYRLGG